MAADNLISYTLVGVNHECVVDLVEIEKSITPNTILITTMVANNEVGSLQPVEEISALCKKNNIIFR